MDGIFDRLCVFRSPARKIIHSFSYVIWEKIDKKTDDSFTQRRNKMMKQQAVKIQTRRKPMALVL